MSRDLDNRDSLQHLRHPRHPSTGADEADCGPRINFPGIVPELRRSQR
jgi:hypothetical protein